MASPEAPVHNLGAWASEFHAALFFSRLRRSRAADLTRDLQRVGAGECRVVELRAWSGHLWANFGMNVLLAARSRARWVFFWADALFTSQRQIGAGRWRARPRGPLRARARRRLVAMPMCARARSVAGGLGRFGLPRLVSPQDASTDA